MNMGIDLAESGHSAFFVKPFVLRYLVLLVKSILSSIENLRKAPFIKILAVRLCGLLPSGF